MYHFFIFQNVGFLMLKNKLKRGQEKFSFDEKWCNILGIHYS